MLFCHIERTKTIFSYVCTQIWIGDIPEFLHIPSKIIWKKKKKKLTPLKKKKIPRNKTARKHEQHFPTCFPFPNVCHLVDFRAILGVKHRTEHLQ